MVVMSLLLTLILSKTITVPISRISNSAKELASGNYSTEFPKGYFREINNLSQTLEYAAAELSKTDRLRSELIANTSHDLRTPLTMITGYAEIMRDIPNENTPENAQIIIDESKRLSSLVNDMLDISKLESGTSQTVSEQFCLTEVIAEELNRYQQLCKRDGYTLTFESNEMIHVTTDRKKLVQALFNLVNNALTHTGADKLVTVRQQTYIDEVDGNRYVRLSVIDTGDGIPEDKLEVIWDRYYKLEGNHKRSVYGSGLGLSIVRKIMGLLNGRCGVFSSNGNGSVFWIEIPF
jgi:signal transduction histidine kinase